MIDTEGLSDEDFALFHRRCVEYAHGKQRMARYFLPNNELIQITVIDAKKIGGKYVPTRGEVFYILTSFISDAFNSDTGLKEIAMRYGLSSKRCWLLLEELGLDPWSKIISAYLKRKNLVEVAKKHGIRPDKLSEKLKTLGITPPRGRPKKELPQKEIQKGLNESTSINGLAKNLGVSRTKARYIRETF